MQDPDFTMDGTLVEAAVTRPADGLSASNSAFTMDGNLRPDGGSKISPEVYARALKAAEDLRSQLKERLIGNTLHGHSCDCGCFIIEASELVEIVIPTYYPHQIAMASLWWCRVSTPYESQGLSAYIPRSELYPLFRDAFAGIPVRLDVPRKSDRAW